ncbi:hypothetical protein [Limosilactobacillus caecicola]|nr:hypothetical protein [Limosilactobacillus caecicola]
MDKQATLPQTGNDEATHRAGLIAGSLVALVGLLGLSGLKNRHHN